MLIRYFDFGLFRGFELKLMKEILPKITDDYEIYGFECCKKFYDNLKKVEDDKCKIYNYAISNSNEEKIKLYYSKNLVGHSIYDSKNNINKENYEMVDVIKFSKWLNDSKINLKDSLNIIKINIEGAEWDFFNDLIDNNLNQNIQIYCGAGKDVHKIQEFKNKGIDKKYNKLLKDHNIEILRFSEFKGKAHKNNIDMEDLIRKLLKN
jgi:FkbM family methyltransferase